MIEHFFYDTTLILQLKTSLTIELFSYDFFFERSLLLRENTSLRAEDISLERLLFLQHNISFTTEDTPRFSASSIGRMNDTERKNMIVYIFINPL